MNLSGIFTYQTWLLTWFTGATMMSITWVVNRYVWSYGLELRYPIPYNNAITHWISGVIMFITILLQIPSNWFMITSFRKRLAFFGLLIIALGVLFMSYDITTLFFSECPKNYQPIIALLLPLFKKRFSPIISKLG